MLNRPTQSALAAATAIALGALGALAFTPEAASEQEAAAAAAQAHTMSDVSLSMRQVTEGPAPPPAPPASLLRALPAAHRAAAGWDAGAGVGHRVRWPRRPTSSRCPTRCTRLTSPTCLRHTIARMTFPNRGDDIHIVTYPFHFAGSM